MSGYRARAVREMREHRPGATVTPIMRKLVEDSAELLAAGAPDALLRASDARAHALDHLDDLHAELAENFARRGIGYHQASDGADAVRIVRTLLRGAKRVAKSKSMVAEEIRLTPALRRDGIDVLETDIGEYLVDLEGRGPSHITAPALHLGRAQIRELLAGAGATLPDDDPSRLSRYVRDAVADFFTDCDAAITGLNMAIASSGRLAIVENEGNVALGASHPKLHILVTGYEKVVADEQAALSVLEVLAASATGQPLTAFTHILGDPAPGQQRHVIFVDNGRRRVAAEPRYRDVLKCIRCGACMNGCPIYRVAGGLSYGSPYMGPIGAVLSPLLWPGRRFADLPYASTLCGRCTEACPVGIPLHRMLLDLRRDDVTSHSRGRFAERLAWKAFAAAFKRREVARLALKATGRLLRLAGTPRLAATDPRAIVAPSRDPDMLVPLHERRSADPGSGAAKRPESLVPLLLSRLEGNGVDVATTYRPESGDVLVEAACAIANTGSVVLAGPAAELRSLLAAERLVVRVDPGTTVRYPIEAHATLGDGDAVILTGTSRTADIEKQIVRGIHGPARMVVSIKSGARA